VDHWCAAVPEAAWQTIEAFLPHSERQGFIADLLLLEGNPLTDGASAFRGIRNVIADGRIFETRAPEEPVRADTFTLDAHRASQRVGSPSRN
jgi:hypothetical protein